MRIADEELIRRSRRFNGAHYINLELRIDGQNYNEEGDWLKEIMKELMERRGLSYPNQGG